MSIEKFSGTFSKEKLGVTVLPTQTIQSLRDETLMLWVYLASKPDDWKPNQKEVRTHFNWGERKTSNLFAKLIKTGLLQVTKTREQGRYQNVHYHLLLTFKHLENIDLSPDVGFQRVDNRPSVNAVHTKHREQNIEVTKKTLCPSQVTDATVSKKKEKIKHEDFIEVWNNEMAGLSIGSNGAKHKPLKLLTKGLKAIISEWINAKLTPTDMYIYLSYLKLECFSWAFEPRAMPSGRLSYPTFETFCRLTTYEKQTRRPEFQKHNQED